MMVLMKSVSSFQGRRKFDRYLPYSCVISPERVSNCTIFLSDIPARNSFGVSEAGLNRMTWGILPVLKRAVHWPVSVSQSFILLSYEALRNRLPVGSKSKSFTDLVCPLYVRRSSRE